MRTDVVIDLSAVAMLGVADDMLADANIIVVTAEVISLEFIVEAVCFVKALASTAVGIVPDIGAEMKARDLAAVVSALRFVLLPS